MGWILIAILVLSAADVLDGCDWPRDFEASRSRALSAVLGAAVALASIGKAASMRRSAALPGLGRMPSFAADKMLGMAVVRPRALWIGLLAAGALTLAALATAGGVAGLSSTPARIGAQR
jgi:hypothetical protein